MLPQGATVFGDFVHQGQSLSFFADHKLAYFDLPDGRLSFEFAGLPYCFSVPGGDSSFVGVRYTNVGGMRAWTAYRTSGSRNEFGRVVLDMSPSEPFRLSLHMPGNKPGFTLRLQTDGNLVAENVSPLVTSLVFRYKHPA